MAVASSGKNKKGLTAGGENASHQTHEPAHIESDCNSRYCRETQKRDQDFQIFSHGNTIHMKTHVYQWFNVQSCELGHVVEGERSENIDAVVTEVSTGKTHVNTQQIKLHTLTKTTDVI